MGRPHGLAAIEHAAVVVDAFLPNRLLGVDRIAFDGSHGHGSPFQAQVVEFVAQVGRLRGVEVEDGQFDPVEISSLIHPILANKADMVTGNRFGLGIPEHMPRIKYWGNKRMSQLIRFVSGQRFQDVSCGFRAYNREALMRLNNFGDFTYTHETILSLVFQRLRVLEEPVRVKYYPARKSRVASSLIRYGFYSVFYHIHDSLL